MPTKSRKRKHRKRHTYTSIDAYSWSDVSLQVPLSAGWRPECSQSQTLDFWHALPPDRFDAHLLTDRTSHAVNQPQGISDGHTQSRQVSMIGFVVSVGDIYSALLVPLPDNEVLFCSGFIQRRNIAAQAPIFLQEAAALHALRALREWILQTDQSALRHAANRARDVLVCHHLEPWFRSGCCHLQSVAATGLVHDIQNMPGWLRTKTSLQPLCLPESSDEQGNIPADTMLLLGLAEHLRSAVTLDKVVHGTTPTSTSPHEGRVPGTNSPAP